ncbi:hypothetical protein LSUE1_G006195 [Lachnellula suecica]|uniref:NAD(P)-binding domain-containing protein n=1 Tax=Lachnellula suecica TaxID=602035 RepID=A0A8T9BW93_9HELO|nr:hypothetical protein LSUE1_G006195 [Lachnellula suecica]
MMKLIIAGATGFVGAEVVRQSLQHPNITAVVALSRTPLDLPHHSKLQNVIIEDYGVYPESVRISFEEADACIWTVAITPIKARGMPFEEVKRVCQDCAITGLRTMHAAAVNRPFRFVYVSAITSERDQSKRPLLFTQYVLMRGEAENQLHAISMESKGQLESCAAKPGIITAATFTTKSIIALSSKLFMCSVCVTECAAAMLDQVLNGFTSESLLNDDMVTIGRRVLNQ